MKKDCSIIISGRDITIKASVDIDVKSGKDLVLNGSKILQN
jgi:hypothetical protein